MASQDNKVFLEEQTGIQAQHWKRVSKRKEIQGVVRTFLNRSYQQEIDVLELADGTLQMQNIRTATPQSHGSPTNTADPNSGEPTEEQLQKAKKVVARILADPDVAMNIPKMSSKAFCSQFLFGISGPAANYFSPDGALIAIISPRALWESDQLFFDQEVDLGKFLPPNSEDLNGCGTWIIPGFSRDALEFAEQMMKLGFQTTLEFQEVAANSSEDGNNWDSNPFTEPPREQKERDTLHREAGDSHTAEGKLRL